MINPTDHIRYRSVIARKYRFYYREMEQVLQDFVEDVLKIGATIKGPLFYAIHNVPLDEVLYAEMFVSVENDAVEVMEDMQFHSYFSIEDMISICVFGDVANNTEIAYRLLIDYMEENGLKQTTPIFHVLSGDSSMPYVFIKIGVTDQDGQIDQGAISDPVVEEQTVGT